MTTHQTTEHHIVPLRTYIAIFAALMVLLALTVGAYYVDAGIWSILVGVLIAVVKAVLIIQYFMHVHFSERLVKIFAAVAFIFLLILILFGLNDYLSRSIDPSLPPLPNPIEYHQAEE